VALGKAIFFDTNLSRPKGQSCASCHDPAAGFSHPDPAAPVSPGPSKAASAFRGAQSIPYTCSAGPALRPDAAPPGIMMGMFKGGLFWDGRASTLENQAQEPFLNPLEMNNPSKAAVVAAVHRSAYVKLFRQIYGRKLENEAYAYECIAKALAAYMRSPELNPFTSKYDYWKRSQAVLTQAETNGYALFLFTARPSARPATASRTSPTSATRTSDAAQPGPPLLRLAPALNPDGAAFVDRGLGDVLRKAGVPEEQAAKADGMFKIPALRNCELTAPYTHNGFHKTLREVIVFNNTRDEPTATYRPPKWPRTSTATCRPCREPSAGSA